MNVEKPLSNKRALTGYSSLSVVEHIQTLQEKYQREITSLNETLMIEIEMNQKLKVEVELQQSTPQTNPIEEEITSMIDNLFEQHMVNTNELLNLQNDLKVQEMNYLNELELKKQQIDRDKKRLQGALQYFKTPPTNQGNLGKEQSN
ncbi:hypothetical protein [Paenisporosarcina indica]|uniref:hypothetical protein n=1 Tax=Paenisporosarcina indica TaxID=650093 RepID=UPI00094FC6EA|nr:hypothetical protein [Paenisporosarcina indica]